MDQWVQKTALLIIMFLTVLACYGTTRDLSCWIPESFSLFAANHALHLCAETSTKWELSDMYSKGNKTRWVSQVDTTTREFLKLLLAEAIVVCIVYNVISCLRAAGCTDAKSSRGDLHNSYTKAPLYLLTQSCAGLCWMIFAVVSSNTGNWSNGPGPVFICDIEVRMHGHVERYPTQCVEQGKEFLTLALTLNFALCLVVALCKAVHVGCAFFIRPFLSIKTVRASLLVSGLMENPHQLGVGFALSDLYFTMLASPGEHITTPQPHSAKQNMQNELSPLHPTDS